ncbi:MAG TPA: glycosyltransferase [Aliidongia sp.]|nr:glycosyltransferase [Aliidongia sp.]
MIATLIGAASILAWLYLLLARGLFWRVAEAPPAAGPMIAARVTVVIPARNEADGIATTVISLLTQDHPGPLRIVLVDDHSTDGTADIACAAADALGAADRLEVVAARDLPAGWTGKLWAMSEGLDRARATSADFFLLTDADITHAPDNVSTLVRRAQAGDLDLTSLMVRLSTETLPEKALIPAFVFFFFMLYPPAWAANPRSKMAAAAGGCMLVRPSALERIGGIAAIRGALIDDCSLAAAIKRAGGRIRLDPSTTTRSSRVYGSAGEIWSMIARTAFTQLHYSTLLLVGTVLGLAVTYLAPPLLTLFASGPAWWLGLGAWLAMAACFLPTVRLYGRHPAWALALPAIAAFYSAATIGSAVNYWRGKGGQWKGRSQAIR